MNWRGLVAVTLIVAIAMAVVAVLDRLIALYQTLAGISPYLAGAVVFVLAIALTLSVWTLWRYFANGKSPKTRPIPQVADDPALAAEQNLNGLDQQLQQIEDEIMRQSLTQQASTLRQELGDRPLQIVVFGVGSAGKTSLVNAILAEAGSQDLGATSAVMGTTTIGKFYPPIKLAGKVETIWVDCPGILEASAEGNDREVQARAIAANSDLLLFVIDEDMKQTELSVLQSLCTIGKRVMVVFNKKDRYRPDDLAIIVSKLRQQLAPHLPPSDIITIAAHPTPLPLPNGELVQPPPQLQQLHDRLSAILKKERNLLIADNILLQTQTLTQQAQQIIDQQRQSHARQVIEKYQWWVIGAVFATPLPILDLLATAAIHTQMIMEIGKIYGCNLAPQQSRDLATSLTRTVISLGIVKGVSKIVSTMIQISVVGMILRTAIQSITGAYLTRIAGESFIEYFSRNQDWGDGGINAVVQRQFQLNRRQEFMESFIKSALQQVLTIAKSNNKSDNKI